MRRSQLLPQLFASIPVLLALGVAACGSSEAGGAASPGQASTALVAQARPGAVIRVPQDQPTIAAAMAAAGPGDTVKLAPGTYRETLVLKAGVRVVGGPSTIDATGLDNGITADPTVTGASVSGLIVQGSTYGGIRLDGAAVTLRQVASRGSGSTSGSSGLLALNGARVSLSGCEISGSGGRGLNANFSDVQVEESRILDNGAAGIGMEGSTARISKSLLRGNGGFGNVRVSYGSQAILEENQLLDSGRGVTVDDGFDPADPRPATATLEGNLVQGNGYGVLVTHGSSARLEANRIVGIVGNGGIGLRVDGGDDLADQRRSSVRMERNLLTGSAAGLQVINSDAWSEADAFDANGFGVMPSFGAAFRASGGSISRNGSHGLWSMDVPLGVFCADPDCTTFLAPQATVHVSLDGMRVEENAGLGVVAQPGGVLSIGRSSVLRNGDNGVFGNSGAEGLHGSMMVRHSRIEGNAGWCAIASGDYALDLGSGEGGGNTCVGNGGGVANTSSSQQPIPAEGNWWGTADASAIAAMMYGPVDFLPFLTAAP